MKALIIVDIQNDFCPGGSLAVKDGDCVIEPANRLIEKFTAEDKPVIFTRDWHPADHASFADFGGMWPVHCVAGTVGAAFHDGLSIPVNAIVISKAKSTDKDAYSGFEGTDLNEKLQSLRVDSIVIAGLATDYCVKNTALDAVKNGYHTVVAEDCIRAVNVNPGDDEKAISEMRSSGAAFKSVAELVR